MTEYDRLINSVLCENDIPSEIKRHEPYFFKKSDLSQAELDEFNSFGKTQSNNDNPENERIPPRSKLLKNGDIEGYIRCVLYYTEELCKQRNQCGNSGILPFNIDDIILTLKKQSPNIIDSAKGFEKVKSKIDTVLGVWANNIDHDLNYNLNIIISRRTCGSGGSRGGGRDIKKNNKGGWKDWVLPRGPGPRIFQR